ncbi:PilZ domain-containing protein [Halopseudomonas salegens]|uniref:PilZ domain-containing protein n=1 Tax=Halopseudomonas salegens TaxID=1434072 RepID=A0A1H2HMV8_9GAMM|nr:PilZ domain-containing protein [Halopseudomonas salegens]SDU33174.1 PilZ domain-containing protein [Halopseudomonas salegens]
MADQRQYPRTMMQARIKITHPDVGEVFGFTRDLSDGGVFVENAELAALPPGTEVEGQVQGMPIEAPILRMRVMRSVPGDGVGLAFVDDE